MNKEIEIDLSKLSDEAVETLNKFMFGGMAKLDTLSKQDVFAIKMIDGKFKDVTRQIVALPEKDQQKEFSRYFAIIYQPKIDNKKLSRILKDYNINKNDFISDVNNAIIPNNEGKSADNLNEVFNKYFGVGEALDDEMIVFDEIWKYFDFKSNEYTCFTNFKKKISK